MQFHSRYERHDQTEYLEAFPGPLTKHLIPHGARGRAAEILFLKDALLSRGFDRRLKTRLHEREEDKFGLHAARVRRIFREQCDRFCTDYVV